MQTVLYCTLNPFFDIIDTTTRGVPPYYCAVPYIELITASTVVHVASMQCYANFSYVSYTLTVYCVLHA